MKVIDIYEEVKAAKTIGISGHIRPDGDCVGSCLGLYLLSEKEVQWGKGTGNAGEAGRYFFLYQRL